MEHGIEWYQGLMDDLEEEFEPVVELFERLEDMKRPTWNLPASFTAVVKDVMAIVDTAPSDAINAAAIAFAGSLPIFNVTPFMPNPAEYDRVQGLEDNIGYHFEQANRRGLGSVMYDQAESSLLYNTICVRTDDLAHILPKSQSKWSSLQKRAWSSGRFINKIVNPKKVRYIISDLGLVMVGHVEQFKVTDIVKYWELYASNETDEGKRVQQGLDDLNKKVSELQDDKNNYKLKDLYFSQTYCIDDDKLLVWGSVTTNAGDDVSDDDIVFADQKNPYGFIPWSVRVAGSRLEDKIEYKVNPMLAPLYWSGSWDKLNLAKSIIFSEPIRRAREPRRATITQSGEPPQIDYENGSDINLRVGENVQPLQPLTYDQGGLAILAQLEAAMDRTTGASAIGNATQASSRTPFSTYSAMQKVALSRLDKQRAIMAESCVDISCNMLWWVDKTKQPLESYATVSKQYKSGKQIVPGAKNEVMPQDFDLSHLGITATIKPMTATDEMEQINMAILLSTKLNVPVSQALEKLGYKNVGLMYETWAKEFLQNAQIQATAAGMSAEAQAMAQVKAQQAAQQMQQQQQQQQNAQAQQQPGQGSPGAPMGPGGDMSQQSFGSMGGSPGFNPAIGGSSPAQGAPSMTREAVNGQPNPSFGGD